MEENVGEKDGKLRIGIGAVLVGLGALADTGLLPFAGNSSIALILSILGLILVLTGYFRKCLLYRSLGIDTSR